MTESSRSLAEFEAAVSCIWEAYQQQGPGKLAPEELEPVEQAFAELEFESLPEGLVACVQQLHTLAQRSVLRPEGLSFVTGEAGLLPRKDLHAAFDESLAWLRGFLQQAANGKRGPH